MKILLDYFFKITAVSSTPQASTAFLKQVALVVKPKGGVTSGTVQLVTSMAQVAALTDNTEAQQLFNAGMSRLYIVAIDDLDLTSALEENGSDFFTLLISSDFADADIELAQADGTVTVTSYANLVSGDDDGLSVAGVVFNAQETEAVPGEATFQAATSNDATAASIAAQINAHETVNKLVVAEVAGAVVTLKAVNPGFDGNDIAVSYSDQDTNAGITLGGLTGGKLAGGAGLSVGAFEGVVGISSTDEDVAEAAAVTENRVGFLTTVTTKAKNMAFAFGKLLSNALDWTNQQYITMPFADDVTLLGQANNLFDKKISFVLSDDQYGKRLGLFAVGGKAIASPYIKKNFMIDLQSKALQYISANQPSYTPVNAALLEDELQKVAQSYIDRGWVEDAKVEIKLEQDNFVASGYIEITEAGALWRIFGQITETI